MWWLTRRRERGPYFPYPSAEAQAATHRRLLTREAHADRDVLSLCHLGWDDPTTTPHAALPQLRSRLRDVTCGPQLDPERWPRRAGNGYGGVWLRDPFDPAPPLAEDLDVTSFPPHQPRETWRIVAGWVTRGGADGTIASWADADYELEEWLVGLLAATGARVPDAKTRAHARSTALRGTAALLGQAARR